MSIPKGQEDQILEAVLKAYRRRAISVIFCMTGLALAGGFILGRLV